MTETAQWKEELDTYGSIQKMLIFEGNINDLQMLPGGSKGGELVRLDEYLHIYLRSRGYHTVVFYNRIDGFYNHYDESGKMVADFHAQAQTGGGLKKPDIQTAMNTIRRALSVQGDSVAVVIQMAGQLIGNADHPDTEETEYLTTLMLAAGDATTGRADNTKGWANNVIFLMTNKKHKLQIIPIY